MKTVGAVVAIAAAAIIAALTPACDTQTLDEASCPPGGTDLTYENFGRSFMERYCQYCHASFLEDRQGAPPDETFDDLASIQKHAAHIYSRSAGDNKSMPPGPDDPPADERADLAEWLACGAPGGGGGGGAGGAPASE